jgi:hypothetical protein
MDEALRRLLERLLGIPRSQGLDRQTSHIFAFYEMMLDDPGLPPEAFLTGFPGSQVYYPVVLLFARAQPRR